MKLIGGKDGQWANANVGVVIALFIAFAAQWISLRST
jgi:hypothetical protein